MPKRKLHEEIDKIETKEDFSKFVLYILEDYQQNYKKWGNQKLPDFLEAVSAWSMDMDGYYANIGKTLPENIAWKVFAEILCAARIY